MFVNLKTVVSLYNQDAKNLFLKLRATFTSMINTSTSIKGPITVAKAWAKNT